MNGWTHIFPAKEVSHAAFEAWQHGETGAVAILLWFINRHSSRQHWRWRVLWKSEGREWVADFEFTTRVAPQWHLFEAEISQKERTV